MNYKKKLKSINGDEEYNSFLKEQFIKKYKRKLRLIRRKISSCSDYLKINECSILYDFFNENKANKLFINYLKKSCFNFIENGIKILYSTKDFWDDIKYYISNSITKLEVPFSLIKYDLSFLDNFSNLKTLVFDEYLTKEDIALIYEKTNIRDICMNSLINYRNIDSEKDFLVAKIDGSSKFVMYKDLVIRINEVIDKNSKNTKLEICSYNLDNDKVDKIIKLCENYVYSNVIISVYSTNYFDDLSYYDKLDKVSNLSFRYNEYILCNLESFKGYTEGLKWYKEIINDGDLSPVEKVMFAFDIVKTFKYKENIDNKSDSREPHRIMENGNIVCVGYCKLLEQILKNLDDNIKIGNFSVNMFDVDLGKFDYHERSMVVIDDDKYNIHGIFAIDSTWDSFNNNLRFLVGNEYNALDLYNYFLIPACDYINTFPCDSIPLLFEIYLNNSFVNDDNKLLKNYNYIFDGSSFFYEEDKRFFNEKLVKYLSAERPSLEVFSEILYNVRISEGFSSKEALEDVKKVIRINNEIINTEREMGSNISFFKSRKLEKSL